MKVGKRIFLLLLALLMPCPEDRRRRCWKSAPRAKTCARCSSASYSTTIWTASRRQIRRSDPRCGDPLSAPQRPDGGWPRGAGHGGGAGRDALLLRLLVHLGDDHLRRPPPAFQAGLRRGARGKLQRAGGRGRRGLKPRGERLLSNTISGVIYQSGAFSCVSNGSINNTPDSTAIRAALDALNGWDPTGGCLYYYNPRKTDDEWIRTRTVKTVIGNHYFAV